MGFEHILYGFLNNNPRVKRPIKRIYQRGMCLLSSKMLSEGNFLRVSPDDGAEYFFGYYDKSPWDASGRYMLCMRAMNTWSDVAPNELAQILLIDTANCNRAEIIAQTRSWNVQQGCMLQWLGPD